MYFRINTLTTFGEDTIDSKWSASNFFGMLDKRNNEIFLLSDDDEIKIKSINWLKPVFKVYEYENGVLAVDYTADIEREKSINDIYSLDGLYESDYSSEASKAATETEIISIHKEPITGSESQRRKIDTYGFPISINGDINASNSNLSTVSVVEYINMCCHIKGWSKIKTYKIDFLEGHLLQQIRTRYAMYDRPTHGLSNVIIDSFAPRCLYSANFDEEKARDIMSATKTFVAISPWFAKIFGVREMEIEQLCRIVGFSKLDIKNLLTKVKSKQHILALIGYGGTGVNTLHWLTKMSEMTKVVNIFDRIDVWEKETAEASNLLRFPIDPRTAMSSNGGSRLRLDGSDSRYNYSNQSLKTRLLTVDSNERLSSNKINVWARYYNVIGGKYHSYDILKDENGRIKTDTDGNYIYGNIKLNDSSQSVIMYGAPGITTRQELSKYGNFISATHGDDSCRLDLNPEQDQEIQVESYGMIQLGGFFINQLRLAIGLLETLARDDINYLESDKTLLDFKFDGESKLPTDRKYNFQLSHNGLVTTAEETNII